MCLGSGGNVPSMAAVAEQELQYAKMPEFVYCSLTSKQIHPQPWCRQCRGCCWCPWASISLLPCACPGIWTAWTTRVHLMHGAWVVRAQHCPGFVCNSCGEHKATPQSIIIFLLEQFPGKPFFFLFFLPYFPPSFSFCNVASGFKRGRKITV